MYNPHDTIAAIASSAGGAARGMVRVSGADTLSVIKACFAATNDLQLDAVRNPTAISGHLCVPPALPCDLFYWPDERSYTREPVAELHTFGSPPLLDAVLRSVCRAGARLAERGEFTLRAFLAGRLDLTQAEAVLGVIEASAKDELDAALAQLAGGLARPLNALRNDLLQLLAELEAGLDFVDEDIEFISADDVVARLAASGRLLDEVFTQLQVRETSNHLRRVVLVGRPNAGKSSLFNALVRFANRGDAFGKQSNVTAIVSPMRGTTRDYLVARVDLAGAEFELVDTAGVDEGLYETPGAHATKLPELDIDDSAQHAAGKQRREADIRLWCMDATEVESAFHAEIDCERDVVVVTKCDLAKPDSIGYDSTVCAALLAYAPAAVRGMG